MPLRPLLQQVSLYTPCPVSLNFVLIGLSRFTYLSKIPHKTVCFSHLVHSSSAFSPPHSPWFHPKTLENDVHGWLSHRSGRQPKTYVKPEAAFTVFSSWWWAVCRPKHFEQLRNIGIINSTTRLHLVGSFYEFYPTTIRRWLYQNLLTCSSRSKGSMAKTTFIKAYISHRLHVSALWFNLLAPEFYI